MGYCPQARLGTGRTGVGAGLGAGALGWALGWAPGAGREGMRGRGCCRQLGARAQGAADVCGRVRA